MYAGKPYDPHVDLFSARVIVLILAIRKSRPMYDSKPIGYTLDCGISIDTILQ
jgi:hypothetical protein